MDCWKKREDGTGQKQRLDQGSESGDKGIGEVSSGNDTTGQF